MSTKGEANVVFKGLLAATVAVALSATPALAAANTAHTARLAPAAETVDGSELGGSTSIIVIALAVIAAGLGLWAIVDDGGDEPVSP